MGRCQLVQHCDHSVVSALHVEFAHRLLALMYSLLQRCIKLLLNSFLTEIEHTILRGHTIPFPSVNTSSTLRNGKHQQSSRARGTPRWLDNKSWSPWWTGSTTCSSGPFPYWWISSSERCIPGAHGRYQEEARSYSLPLHTRIRYVNHLRE